MFPLMSVLDALPRNVIAQPMPIVVLAAGVAKDVLADTTKILSDDIVSIQLFNAGQNNAYYCYGVDCDNVNNFNAFIVPGQQLSVQTRERVSMYSVGGTSISITKIIAPNAITNNQ